MWVWRRLNQPDFAFLTQLERASGQPRSYYRTIAIALNQALAFVTGDVSEEEAEFLLACGFGRAGVPMSAVPLRPVTVEELAEGSEEEA